MIGTTYQPFYDYKNRPESLYVDPRETGLSVIVPVKCLRNIPDLEQGVVLTPETLQWLGNVEMGGYVVRILSNLYMDLPLHLIAVNHRERQATKGSPFPYICLPFITFANKGDAALFKVFWCDNGD